MRTVLLGSDFVYNSDGNLVPLEINTQVGMSSIMLEDWDEIFDLTNLKNFIISNNFKKITYIGALRLFSDELSSYCSGLTQQIEFNNIKMTGGISVPDIQDDSEHLIIRSAYDYSAIVDDVYCRDKINFMNLIKNKTFGSQFAYLDDNEQLVNNITIIKDNGNMPNFILKAIFPQYDRMVYPKFYKINNQNELNTVLQSIEPGYFLMEFHYNENKLYGEHMKIFRSLNILFPPNLDNIPIGSYTMLPDRKIDNLNEYDPITHELLDEHRIKFLSSDGELFGPKLLDTDLVYMADNTFKSGLDLEAGDVVKTLDIPNPNNVDVINMTVNYQIDYETFVSGTTYDTNTVLSKVKVDKLVYYIELTFTDQTTWSDTQTSSYLVLRDNDVRFVFLDSDLDDGIKIGDNVILVDTSSETISTVIKEVESITKTKQIFSGWSIAVDEEHLFLTKSTTETSSYVSIEHNAYCGAPSPYNYCETALCSKPQICCTDNICKLLADCSGCGSPPTTSPTP